MSNSIRMKRLYAPDAETSVSQNDVTGHLLLQ